VKGGTGAEKSAACGTNCRGFGRVRLSKNPNFIEFSTLARALLNPGMEYQAATLAAFVGVPSC
jgi:hypothetical protein